MILIQQAQEFETLKPFFLPAIYHRILDGNKKMYQLSISIEGIECIIKKSAKPFEFASFNQVISGAVMRMQKLFQPEALDLEVVLYDTPNLNEQHLSFELVNQNLFVIGDEEYYASIMVEYDYENMEEVTYFPIIYRKICNNGQLAEVAKNFTETIHVSQIFEIGCEWTRCNFETYQNNLATYFDHLRNQESNLSHDAFVEEGLRQIEDVLGIRESLVEEVYIKSLDFPPTPRRILEGYIDNMGRTPFAIWNALTDLASQETDVSVRNQMFIKAGRYLTKQMEKTLKKNDSKGSVQWVWDDIKAIASN